MKNLHPLLYGTLVLALVGTLFTFTACEKTKVKLLDNQTVRSASYEPEWVEFSNEEISTKLTLLDNTRNSFSGDFLGHETKAITFSQKLCEDFKTLSIERSSSESPLYILNKGAENEIEIGEFTKISSKNYTFSIRLKDSEKRIFSIKHNGHIEFDQFVNGIADLNEFIINNGGYENIDKIDLAAAIPWGVYVGIIIIVKLVDDALEHCSEIVQAGVSACSAAGKCFTVKPCSVDCYMCNDN